MGKPVEVVQHGAVTVVTLDRPDVRNVVIGASVAGRKVAGQEALAMGLCDRVAPVRTPIGTCRWRFSQRLLSFMYHLPVEEYRTAMGVLERNCAGSAPVAADWPERMPTWTEHRPDRRKAG